MSTKKAPSFEGGETSRAASPALVSRLRRFGRGVLRLLDPDGPHIGYEVPSAPWPGRLPEDLPPDQVLEVCAGLDDPDLLEAARRSLTQQPQIVRLHPGDQIF